MFSLLLVSVWVTSCIPMNFLYCLLRNLFIHVHRLSSALSQIFGLSFTVFRSSWLRQAELFGFSIYLSDGFTVECANGVDVLIRLVGFLFGHVFSNRSPPIHEMLRRMWIPESIHVLRGVYFTNLVVTPVLFAKV